MPSEPVSPGGPAGVDDDTPSITDREARLFVWRRRIQTLERIPWLADTVDMLANTLLPADDFADDVRKYRGIAATADDYLQFGHFSTCSECYQAIALYPAHTLDFPDMTLHDCTWNRALRDEGIPSGPTAVPKTPPKPLTRQRRVVQG